MPRIDASNDVFGKNMSEAVSPIAIAAKPTVFSLEKFTICPPLFGRVAHVIQYTSSERI